MTEILKDKLSILYHLISAYTDKQKEVLNIVENFFGKDNVDCQIPDYNFHNHFIEYCNRPIADSYFKNYIETDSQLSIKELPIDIIDNIIQKVEVASDYEKLAIRRELTGDNNPTTSCMILVYFPEVRVTNENDKYIDITDLFVRFYVSPSGLLYSSFQMTRSSCTTTQYNSRYFHSHLHGIPEDFESPCLGTGPIRNTICNLQKEFDADIWNLFCLELSKYVETESIAGTPYNYLERVNGYRTQISITDDFCDTYFSLNTRNEVNRHIKEMLLNFFKKILNEGHLKFIYSNNKYTLGMSFVDAIVLISNEFLDFIDSYDTSYFNINNLYSLNILRYCIINKDFNRLDLIKLSDYNYGNNISDRVGKYVCEFKGKPVTFSIAAEIINNDEFTYYVVLHPSIILKFLLYTLYNINKYYGNK